MLRTLSIHNFKCFDKFVLGPLSRFNLITGENDLGKTALLEALFLHSGAKNPALATSINVFRGMDKLPANPEILWGWHFRHLDFSRPIELKGQREDLSAGPHDGKVEEDLLTISLQRASNSTQQIEGEGLGGAPEAQATTETIEERYLAYEYKPAAGTTIHGFTKLHRRASVPKPQARLFTQSDAKQEETAQFLSARTRVFSFDAKRLSNLIAKKQKSQVVDAVRLLDKRVEELQVHTGDVEPYIMADIGLPEMMPLPYAGEGLTRFVSIVIGVLNISGGLLLIDEIENGLHHSVLARVFQALIQLAKDHEVQVVATTHSRECVKAFYQASKSFTQPEMALFRVERDNGKRRLIHYDEASLEAAMDAEFEVR